MSGPKNVTVRRVCKGYIVVEQAISFGTTNKEYAFGTIEEAIEKQVLLLGNDSFYGYPLGTKVKIEIIRPTKK